MIIPVGKIRIQEKQGKLRYETILEQFQRIQKEAATPLGDTSDIKSSEPEATLDDVMKDSNSTTISNAAKDYEDSDIDTDIAQEKNIKNTDEYETESKENKEMDTEEEITFERVTDQSEKITKTVQKALGLDASEGWGGSTTIDSAPGGGLTGITIKLKKQIGPRISYPGNR